MPTRRPPGRVISIALLALGLLAAPAARAHGRHDGEMPPPGVHPPFPAAAEVAPPPGTPFVQRRYYLAMDDHTDYMWSADDTTYRGAFMRMLDYYMTQAETTAYRPADLRGRFNADGSIWLWVYEQNRTPAEFQRLMNHVRAGDITVPLNLLVQLYGAMPTEAVIRSFSYAGRIERRENVRFRLVVPMEDQTLPGGVGSLWAGCGARYSWKGICACATVIDAANRPRDIYRFTGPDGQSVLMKWQRMYEGNTSIGGYAEARFPDLVMDRMTTNPDFLADWPYDVAGAFGYGWDDVETESDDILNAASEWSNATRRVIVSNEVDFFQDFEATHGASIGSYGAGFGNDWELNTSSLAEVTARMRRGVERLRTAEALASVASLYEPQLWPAFAALRDSAMLACGLYYEHSWGPGPGVSEGERADWQRRIERAMTRYSDSLLAASKAAVAARIRQPAGVERHAVFNPLSWTRTDVVDLASDVPEPRYVVDVGTGATLRSQTVVVDGAPRLRVRVTGVPSIGYRVLEVRPGPGLEFPPAATVTLPVMDNGIYRVTVGSRGQITSLLDHKDGNRELVLAGGSLNDLGSNTGSGAIVLESAGPVSATIKVAAATPMRRDIRITLFAGLDRIEMRDEALENFSNDQDYDSRFNLTGTTMRHEEVGKIAVVARLASGGDYANENTRTDFLTLNHFVDLSEAARGVTLSSWDSPFFRPGNSTSATLDGDTPRIHAVLGNQINGPGNGITGQGGDAYFLDRFALRTHGAWDAAAAMRFALEHQNPLVAMRVLGGGSSPLPDTAWSLVDLGTSNVLLWALKPAEEGIDRGLIVRAWNLASTPSAVTLTLPPLGIASAMRTTHIETDEAGATIENGALVATLAPQQIGTWRLTPGSIASSGEPDARPRGLAVRPNPARARDGVALSFALSRPGVARLDLLDVRGARVARLLDGPCSAGPHEVRWSGRGDDGRRVPPGLYFTRLETRDGVTSGRFVLLE